MVKTEFTDNAGKLQTRWRKIGHLSVANSGMKYLELYHLPNVVYHVFDTEDVEREE